MLKIIYYILKKKGKVSFDKKSTHLDFKVGDKILLRDKNDPIFNGSYIVIEGKSSNVFIKVGNKLVELHKNRTKLYYNK